MRRNWYGVCMRGAGRRVEEGVEEHVFSQEEHGSLLGDAIKLAAFERRRQR